ncbi:MAG: hypothetical protein JKY41_11405 [Rhodobacteraceae bacterium]|nr:hypothetical protein [Paracoccaceae bacterium]
MNCLTEFNENESGAVTVDWVVLTAAIVGIAIAVIALVSGGVEDASGGINDELVVASNFSSAFDPTTTIWSGKSANDYLAEGSSTAGNLGNSGANYGWATTYAAADAPDGYNFDNPLHTGTNSIIYTSTDGANYSIDGQIIAVDAYTGAALYYGA